MGILSSILNLPGCSGQPKKDTEELSKETKEQLAKSVEAFKNRLIYTQLTEQTPQVRWPGKTAER